MKIHPHKLGAEIYQKLSGENGSESRKNEFADYFHRAVLAYTALILMYPIFGVLIGLPFDFGLFGVFIVFWGSVFYGIGTLTGLSEFENIDEIKRQIFSYQGFLWISGGSIFLFSNELTVSFFENAPEADMISDLLSQSLANQLAEATFILITFLSALLIPFLLGGLLLSVVVSEQSQTE